MLIRDGDELGLWDLGQRVASLDETVSNSLSAAISQVSSELSSVTQQVSNHSESHIPTQINVLWHVHGLDNNANLCWYQRCLG